MDVTALEVVGYAVLIAVGFVQSFEDIDTRRVHVLTTQLVSVWMLFALGISSFISGEPSGIARAGLCALATWLLFLTLDRYTHGGIGKGDVRLAPVTGLATGYLSIDSFALGLLVIAIGGSLVALVAMVRHGASARIPFVPIMYAAVVVSVVVHG